MVVVIRCGRLLFLWCMTRHRKGDPMHPILMGAVRMASLLDRRRSGSSGVMTRALCPLSNIIVVVWFARLPMVTCIRLLLWLLAVG